MRTIGFWTDRETIEEQRAAGRYNAARVVHYWLNGSEYRHAIDAGLADDVDVFEENGRVYVVSSNVALDYCGMQAFDEGVEVGETYLDVCSPNIDYLLGLTPIWRAKRLAQWCDL